MKKLYIVMIWIAAIFFCFGLPVAVFGATGITVPDNTAKTSNGLMQAINNNGALLYDGTTGTGVVSVTGSYIAPLYNLKTVQVKGLAIVNTNWAILTSNNGSGVIRKIWMATANNQGPSNLLMRLRVDGASVPQIGGTGGMYAPQFFGVSDGEFAGAKRGCPRWYQVDFAAYHTMQIPYGTSWSLEVKNPPLSENNNLFWFTIWYEDGGVFSGGPDWRLFAQTYKTNYSAMNEYLIFDRPGNVWLAGIMQRIWGTNTWQHLEDKHFFALNGQPLTGAQIKTSGTEDLTGLAWFFAFGPTHNDSFDCFKNTNGYSSFAYWWPTLDGPAATNGLQIAMEHRYGAISVTNETTVFYYSK